MLGSKASPTTAPKPRRHKSSTSSDMFDDKESSGLFSSCQPQEETAGSPARKKEVCSSSTSYFFTRIYIYMYLATYMYNGIGILMSSYASFIISHYVGKVLTMNFYIHRNQLEVCQYLVLNHLFLQTQ